MLNYKNKTLIFIAFFLYYFWIATQGILSGSVLHKYQPIDNTRHQQIAEAFLNGQTNILVSPKDELINLSDPYDPELNGAYRLHDASLYKGKYYHYFSPVPSILLNIPLKILTGYYFTDSFIGFIFAYLGFLLCCSFFTSVMKNYNKNLSRIYEANSIFLIGFLSLVPFVLRRVNSYEVCILSSFAFLMGSLVLIIRIIHKKNISIPANLSLGICLGLCVASRPNQIFVVIFIIIGFLLLKWKKSNLNLAPIVFLTMAPIFLIFTLLALYNYVRFDSIFEFGQKYQLAGIRLIDVSLFSRERIIPGLFVYLFHPFSLDLIFPYFHVTAPLKPPGHLSKIWFTEPLIGIFSFPVFWLAFLSLPLMNRLYSLNKEITTISLSIFFFGLFNLVFFSMSLGVTMRYMTEFMPLILLSFLFMFNISSGYIFNSRTGGTFAGYFLYYLLSFISCLISFFISFTGYADSLKNQNPAAWENIKIFFDFFLGI